MPAHFSGAGMVTIPVDHIQVIWFVLDSSCLLHTFSMIDMYSLYCGLPTGNSADFSGNCFAIRTVMLDLENKKWIF